PPGRAPGWGPLAVAAFPRSRFLLSRRTSRETFDAPRVLAELHPQPVQAAAAVLLSRISDPYPEGGVRLPLAASLGLTFSYNVTIGIPLYIEISRMVGNWIT